MLFRALTLSLTATLILSAGCAGLGAASDEDQIADLIESWKLAFQGGDLEVAAEIYSEDFSSDLISDKEAVLRSLASPEFLGFVAEADSDSSEAVITIEGDTATVKPIYMEGDQGGFELVHTLAKESDAWKIVGTDGSQL